ncbi:P3 protein [Portunus trituberculatus]|uniref:P3 protein n=1 Tax=Portunus trituberculatus TaxID=210409 RepID=A0A5B7EPY4_PORTR|nr:P3 protein [Portunus trituberculatus]
MWLGLFLTGCSPGGGGSNIWTYLLGGSLDLSVTMTFISTVTAFAALPIWVAVAGLLLPWLGFAFGAVVSLMCHRKLEEIIAISIETGIQNTGISIGVLKTSCQLDVSEQLAGKSYNRSWRLRLT